MTSVSFASVLGFPLELCTDTGSLDSPCSGTLPQPPGTTHSASGNSYAKWLWRPEITAQVFLHQELQVMVNLDVGKWVR